MGTRIRTSFVVFNDEVNDVLAWLRTTLIAGFSLMVWVANRWSGTYGNRPVRRRA